MFQCFICWLLDCYREVWDIFVLDYIQVFSAENCKRRFSMERFLLYSKVLFSFKVQASDFRNILRFEPHILIKRVTLASCTCSIIIKLLCDNNYYVAKQTWCGIYFRQNSWERGKNLSRILDIQNEYPHGYFKYWKLISSQSTEGEMQFLQKF